LAYLIYKSDGTAITIPDNAIDTAYYDAAGGGGFGPGNAPQAGHGLGVQLVGRNTFGYGAAVAQSFLQLQENFCSSVVPNDAFALQGQLWFNQTSVTNGNLYVRTSAATSGGIANWQEIVSTNTGGAANQILYQTAPSSTGFITAPTTANTYLEWNGTSFVWAPAGGGGGGGVSFPLATSAITDPTNSDIGWTSGTAGDPTSFPSVQGDSRVRGTYNTDIFGNSVFMAAEVWYDPYGRSNQSWQTAWAVDELFNPCCGGGNILAVQIPVLSVEQLRGFNCVTSLNSYSSGLNVSNDTGDIAISFTNPASVALSTTPFSTTITNLTQGNFLQSIQSGTTFKITMNGVCTATTLATTTFTLRMGYNNSTLDQIIATFTVNSAVGTNVPFQLTAFVSENSSYNGQVTTMQIMNTGTTGISSQVFTGFPAQNGTYPGNGGWLNLFAQTNSSGLTITPSQVILEQIL